MTSYIATVVIVLLATMFFGWRLGKRKRGQSGKISPLTVIVLSSASVGWFGLAYLSRNLADSAMTGAAAFEWFAHSGKWLVLLGAMSFGHGWIFGSGQVPPGKVRRIFYSVAVLGIFALTISRSVPIYFLLDAGQRDAAGCLRQSQRIETTCGAVALLNYLERYQNSPRLTEREVARACGVTMEGTTTSALVRAAKFYGCTNATARVLTPADLEKIKLPAIVSISTLPTVHHATLLIKLDAENAYFIDPAYGFRDVSRHRFSEIWYGKTVLLE